MLRSFQGFLTRNKATKIFLAQLRLTWHLALLDTCPTWKLLCLTWYLALPGNYFALPGTLPYLVTTLPYLAPCLTSHLALPGNYFALPGTLPYPVTTLPYLAPCPTLPSPRWIGMSCWSPCWRRPDRTAPACCGPQTRTGSTKSNSLDKKGF